jgi:rhamnulose-1-phosphate aldolase
LLKALVKEISKISGYLWDKGWAEKNAGNLSVNVTGLFEQKIPDIRIFSYEMEKSYDGLQDNVILITASGSKMRDINTTPLNHIILLFFDSTGKRFSKFKINNKYILLVTEDIPSSELPTHLEVQNYLKLSGGSDKAVLHTHATELISFSHLKECINDKKMNRKLSDMHPEFKLFIPEGIGLIKEQNSSNYKIAADTIEAIKEHKIVLWKKHGVISIGENLDDAFDLIDIASKSAKIYLLSRNPQ